MMTKKHKGQNNAVAKTLLVKAFEQADQQLKHDRYAATPEGAVAIKLAMELKDIKSVIQVGQRVWKEVIVEDFDSNKILNVCTKIVSIDDVEVKAEMLYCTDRNGQQFDGYTDWDDIEHRKGDEFWFEWQRLEKHTAKTTGNVWWKVK